MCVGRIESAGVDTGTDERNSPSKRFAMTRGQALCTRRRATELRILTQSQLQTSQRRVVGSCRSPRSLQFLGVRRAFRYMPAVFGVVLMGLELSGD